MSRRIDIDGIFHVLMFIGAVATTVIAVANQNWDKATFYLLIAAFIYAAKEWNLAKERAANRKFDLTIDGRLIERVINKANRKRGLS